MWHSDSPSVSSAYGKIGNELLPRLAEMGHQIFIVPKFGYYGEDLDLGYGIMAGIPDEMDFPTSIALRASEWKPDIIVLMVDLWGFRADKLRKLVPHTTIVAYVPIDCANLHPEVKNQLGYVDFVIPMSKHVEKLLTPFLDQDKLLGTIYPPVSEVFSHSKIERGELGFFNHDRVVVMVQMVRDLARKDQVCQMVAVKRAADMTGLKVGLYVHAHPVTGVFDIRQVGREIGFGEDDLRNPLASEYGRGFTDEQMCAMYNAADVVLQCTIGEGFGMPTAEATLCGTPVVGSLNTATKELMEITWPEYGVRCDEMIVFRTYYDTLPSFDDMVSKLASALKDGRKDQSRAKRLGPLVSPANVAKMWDSAFKRIKEAESARCFHPPPINPVFPTQANLEGIIEVKK